MTENKCPECNKPTPPEDGEYCRHCGMSFVSSLRKQVEKLQAVVDKLPRYADTNEPCVPHVDEAWYLSYNYPTSFDDWQYVDWIATTYSLRIFSTKEAAEKELRSKKKGVFNESFLETLEGKRVCNDIFTEVLNGKMSENLTRNFHKQKDGE